MRALDLSIEHGQLPAEQGVLYHQLRPGAGEVKGNVQGQSTVLGLGPLAESLLDALEERPCKLKKEAH
ncbi:MAG: hypothetical protein BAJATHORv1_150015 [Candidatus Thorarchaeota archaeon]|nr:MAG: hypothetical protein BAJATHORv1_150015 [Candidatus Thorarchaeota archaeon]